MWEQDEVRLFFDGYDPMCYTVSVSTKIIGNCGNEKRY